MENHGENFHQKLVPDFFLVVRKYRKTAVACKEFF